MVAELLAAHYILRAWLACPDQPRRDYTGVSWLERHPEPDTPLALSEVDEYKRFLRAHAPTAFSQLFPSEA